jgi:hypothetical protein
VVSKMSSNKLGFFIGLNKYALPISLFLWWVIIQLTKYAISHFAVAGGVAHCLFFHTNAMTLCVC